MDPDLTEAHHGIRPAATRGTAIVLSNPGAQDLYPAEAFAAAGFDMHLASTPEDARTLCDAHSPSVVVMPLRLAGQSMIPYMKRCKDMVGTAVLVIADNHQIDEAAEAMREGADDCLFLPFSTARLTRALKAVLSGELVHHLPLEPRDAQPATPERWTTLDGEAGTETVASPDGLIAQCPEMRRLVARVATIADAHEPVLIHGEVGTGKSAFARAIHARSRRAEGPLVTVDCAGTDQSGLERLIFDDAPGSARVAAVGGTLVLDRIDEMPLDLQGRLLPLLQPCDERDASVPDIRIIATLAGAPSQALAAKRLRRDVYYLLNVITFALPPLRLREGDVGRILSAKIAEISRRLDRAPPTIDSEALTLLTGYHWPGNLSELVGWLRGALITCGDRIGPHDLPPELHMYRAGATLVRDGSEPPQDASFASLVGQRLADIERAVIEATIQAEGGSVPRAARVLDVSPSTIYRKRDGWSRESSG